MVTNNHNQIVREIIKEQELIVGPVALDLAKKVEGLAIEDGTADDVNIVGDPMQVLDQLVIQYSKLFGQTSIEVCKMVVQRLQPDISNESLPESLR